MSIPTKPLRYSDAINAALVRCLTEDKSALLIGQGVQSPWYVGSTCEGLIKKFGKARIIDTPVSENAVTGAAVGAALAGSRSVVVHPRVDFMLYAMDPIINQASNWHYMFDGQINVPVVFWGIVNRGGEQGAQHSQNLSATFAHIPGLKVYAPSNASDAYELMVKAFMDNNPVFFLDDRHLYGETGVVDIDALREPTVRSKIVRRGTDVTLVAYSNGTRLAVLAADTLSKHGIDAEVLNLRVISPLDRDAILESVRRTKRAVVIDEAWHSFGISAEIAALISAELFGEIACPVERITFPDAPTPASSVLEEAYFFNEEDVVHRCLKMIK